MKNARRDAAAGQKTTQRRRRPPVRRRTAPLEYANSVWNPYRVTGLIMDLEKVQMRATKLVPGKYYKVL